jgi:predicted O-methyltransferase YrrM
MGWKFSEPEFDYQEEFTDYLEVAPWLGHIFFSYDLINNLCPSTIVELGTYKGTSLFSFLQSIKDNELDTEVFAVDTWRGDKHGGFYAEEIYEHVKRIINEYYSRVDVKLKKMLFDEAIKDFDDRSIDLLHIDGLHTYEAVKHDFDNWKDKVKENGVILFHDIVVEKDDFGVKDLWEEIKANNNFGTVEMHHSNGLGVMFLDKDHSVFKDLQGIDIRSIYEDKYHIFLGKKGEDFISQYSSLNHQIKELRESVETLVNENNALKEEANAYKETIDSIRNRKVIRLLNMILGVFGRRI